MKPMPPKTKFEKVVVDAPTTYHDTMQSNHVHIEINAYGDMLFRSSDDRELFLRNEWSHDTTVSITDVIELFGAEKVSISSKYPAEVEQYWYAMGNSIKRVEVSFRLKSPIIERLQYLKDNDTTEFISLSENIDTSTQQWKNIDYGIKPNETISYSDYHVVATDASLRNGQKKAAIGIVSENGKYYVSNVITDDSNVAEIIAIYYAYRKFKTPMIVQTDSMAAIKFLTDDEHFTLSGNEKLNNRMIRMKRLIAAKEIVFEKVKGHSHHALNDVADRLSRSLRRQEDIGVINIEVFDNIVSEVSDTPKYIGSKNYWNVERNVVSFIENNKRNRQY